MAPTFIVPVAWFGISIPIQIGAKILFTEGSYADIPNIISTCLAAILLLLAIWFIAATSLLFKRHATSLNATSPESACKLVTTGTMRFSRNPIYVGAVGVNLAIALFLSNWVSFPIPVILFLILNFVQIPKEERELIDLFGDEYRTFMTQTRRWL